VAHSLGPHPATRREPRLALQPSLLGVYVPEDHALEVIDGWLVDNDGVIKGALGEVAAGVAATLLTRAVDAQFVQAVMLDGDKDERTFVLLDLMLKGLGYALSLMTERLLREPAAPLVATTAEMEPWTHGILVHCGWTVLVRELVHAAREGHVRLEVDDQVFRFKVPGLDGALIARSRSHHLGWLLAACEAGEAARKAVAGVDQEALAEDVATHCTTYQQHYLAYRSTEGIRAAVVSMGQAYAAGLLASQQPVHEAASDLPMDERALLAQVCEHLHATAFEQVLFTRALLLMEPELRLDNLLTPLKSLPHVADDLATRLKVEPARIREALACLVASPYNFGEATRPRWMIPPPYVQIQDGAIVQSISGHLLAPLVFALNERVRRQDATREVAARLLLGGDAFRLPLQSELPLGEHTICIEAG
jgi:hypothetical protein